VLTRQLASTLERLPLQGKAHRADYLDKHKIFVIFGNFGGSGSTALNTIANEDPFTHALVIVAIDVGPR
jgi:hypothetical protein